jgi:hypothetical protein
MKKIILIIIVFFNILPLLNSKGELSIFQTNKASAQMECIDGEWWVRDDMSYCWFQTDNPDGDNGNLGMGDPNNWGDEGDPNDPTNDENWGYPDAWDDYWGWDEWDDTNYQQQLDAYNSFPTYYITLNNDNTKKYFNNDKAFFIKQNKKVRLYLNVSDPSASTPPSLPGNLSWEINGVSKCNNSNFCECQLKVVQQILFTCR